MKRIIPCLLVLVVCITCLVFPVSAESFDQLSMFNLLDYTSLNDDGSNTLSVVGDHTFIFNCPSRYFVGYVDILVTITGGNDSISASIARFSGADPSALNVDFLGNSLYRISGEILYFDYTSFYLTISSSSQESRRYNFISFDVSPTLSDHYDLAGDMSVRNAIGTAKTSFTAGSSVTLDFPSADGTTMKTEFTYTLRPFKCEYYDYVFVSLFLNNQSIFSISAGWEDTVVPVHILSYFDSDADYTYINLVLDLSSISRTDGTDSNIPVSLYITGEHNMSSDFPYYIVLNRCYGVVDIEEPSQFRILILKLESLFGSLQDKLDDIFGTDDPDVEDAITTQDDINILINNQIIGAVEDWNTNIDVVEVGYDAAFLKTTPALSWLASLADRVFSNMGWFGNIYFLLGLISVIMLVLSKSGLARSVGRIRRND